MAERQYRIHPAIGIARVGNAVRSDADNGFYFVGPEVPDVPANVDPVSGKLGEFKIDGRIKPQAARFYVFEYEKQADGKFHPIGQVTTNDPARAVRITWTVHLANRKASFCRFGGQAGAEDQPFFSTYRANNMRNATITTLAERQKWLELDGKAQTIAGGDTASVAHFRIDRPNKSGDGTKSKIETLGELRSDAAGHLLVIGGMGQSDFDPAIGPETLTTFANNEGWFDDMSDSPVEAQLTIDGVPQAVVGAWVVVGPPDFAPAVRSYRTMYDTLLDVMVREMTIPADDGLFAGPLAHIAAMNQDWQQNGTIKTFKPSFTRDIAPTLRAICRMDRVHPYQRGPVAAYHGSMSDLNFGVLGGPGSLPANRATVLNRLRDPNTFDQAPRPAIDPTRMPSTYGDYYGRANGRGGDTDPAFLHAVSKLQYAMLRAWSEGSFVEDWGTSAAAASAITPEGLDRAALDNMSGGAFFPGMEASWLFAKKEVWTTPFRIARGKKVGSIPVPGETTRRDLIVEAGTFSQQMAVPWQADFRDCAFGPVSDPTAPDQQRQVGWWPTNRPDEVFAHSAPNDRVPWARLSSGDPFPNDDAQGFRAMVDSWFTLGFVCETTPQDAPKQLYEVEFNKTVPVA
jgi:hypothetical protein